MAFAAIWAAEMKDVRWQWLEKRTLERKKISAGGDGCQAWSGHCGSATLTVKRRIQFTCLSCVLSPFPLCQHCLKTRLPKSEDFSLPTLQCSGKPQGWSKKLNKNVAQVVVAEEGKNVPYFSRECVGKRQPWQIVSVSHTARLYVKWLARIMHSL